MRKQTSSNGLNSSRLKFERLEDRALLAGNNVTVAITNGDLVINGDKENNQIAILQTSYDHYRVESNGDTKINGGRFNTFSFSGSQIKDDWLINMGDGKDFLDISGGPGFDEYITIPDELIINMGGASDNLLIMFTETHRDISINMGTGDLDKVEIVGGGPSDDLIIKNETIARGYGTVNVNIKDVSIVDDLFIDLYYSKDRVNITGTLADSYHVALNGGNDALSVRTSFAFGTSSILDGGAGDDDLNFYKNRSSFKYQNFKSPTAKNIRYV